MPTTLPAPDDFIDTITEIQELRDKLAFLESLTPLTRSTYNSKRVLELYLNDRYRVLDELAIGLLQDAGVSPT